MRTSILLPRRSPGLIYITGALLYFSSSPPAVILSSFGLMMFPQWLALGAMRIYQHLQSSARSARKVC